MASMSSFSSSVNESRSEEEFQLFKAQLKKVQDLIEEYNNKSMYTVFIFYGILGSFVLYYNIIINF